MDLPNLLHQLGMPPVSATQTSLLWPMLSRRSFPVLCNPFPSTSNHLRLAFHAQLTYPFSALTETWCAFSSLRGDCVTTNPNIERILLPKSR